MGRTKEFTSEMIGFVQFDEPNELLLLLFTNQNDAIDQYVFCKKITNITSNKAHYYENAKFPVYKRIVL